MLRLNEIRLPLDHSLDDLKRAILKCLRIKPERLIDFKVIKRSLDARSHQTIYFIYSIDVLVKGETTLLKRNSSKKRIQKTVNHHYKYVAKAPKDFLQVDKRSRPIVIGAGPCGYFAALVLAQMGFKPLLLERGKRVKERTLETFGFWRGQHFFNPESNVQFGEGGAGTFSDGKLYSQVSDPERYGRKVLEELVASGANEEILTTHRAHIGTFKLASVVRGLRSRIEHLGGEVLFETRVDELVLQRCNSSGNDQKTKKIIGLKLANGKIVEARHVILAIGHSARDSFYMLEDIGVSVSSKLFSVGFRIEHPQSIIDSARWGAMAGHPKLGHAEYKLVYHAKNGRSVYSFCMCPGGLVVGSTSEEGCVVTNGMSQHSRNERNANAALVVNVEHDDMLGYERWPGDPLVGVAFQRDLENQAFSLGGDNYFAPAQRLEDFLLGRPSRSLGLIEPSYLPGVRPSDLQASLPQPLIEAMKEALPEFAKRIPGFNHPDAVLTAVETRTSSPVRISRDASYESINTKGLFPAGEGAGYAGGILSAGIDGIKVAEAMALKILG